MISPSVRSTRRSTPCVLGCCGPMLTSISSVRTSNSMTVGSLVGAVAGAVAMVGSPSRRESRGRGSIARLDGADRNDAEDEWFVADAGVGPADVESAREDHFPAVELLRGRRQLVIEANGIKGSLHPLADLNQGTSDVVPRAFP